jgi:hypothetical protein
MENRNTKCNIQTSCGYCTGTAKLLKQCEESGKYKKHLKEHIKDIADSYDIS